MMQLLLSLVMVALAFSVSAQETPAVSPETLQRVAPPVASPEEFIDPEASPDDAAEPAAAEAVEPSVAQPQPVQLEPEQPATPQPAALQPAPVATPAPVTVPTPANGEKATENATPEEQAAPADSAVPEEVFQYDVAVLQGLNKVTARISEIEAPVGTSVRFGNLDIVVNRCWKSSPTEQPENAARVSIIERRPDEPPVEVFNGWLFSSSPSLSGLEHPVYDLVILACQKRKMEPNT